MLMLDSWWDDASLLVFGNGCVCQCMSAVLMHVFESEGGQETA